LRGFLFPVFWQYLLRSYIKVFFLSVLSFIFVLLVTRIQDIARFIALASNTKSIFLYILYQIPHILPLAIPISCLISSLLLFQRLSHTHEMTSLRACGLSLTQIISPLLFAAFLVFLVNFYVTAELTPQCRLYSKEIVYSQTSQNPLLLMQRQNLLQLKNLYVDMEMHEGDSKAKNVFFAMKNPSNQRLNLVFAKQLDVKNILLVGKNISFFSHIEPNSPDLFDILVLENQQMMTTNAHVLAESMKPNRWTVNPNYLSLRMLLIRKNLDPSSKNIRILKVELIRRFGFAFSAFSFTCIGMAFGTEISRVKRKKGLIFASSLALIILLGFAFAKTVRAHVALSLLIYIVPQILALSCSFWVLRRTSRGFE
jgi:lipopolysaccharide export system permease protein